jgi:hypothetical protein
MALKHTPGSPISALCPPGVRRTSDSPSSTSAPDSALHDSPKRHQREFAFIASKGRQAAEHEPDLFERLGLELIEVAGQPAGREAAVALRCLLCDERCQLERLGETDSADLLRCCLGDEQIPALERSLEDGTRGPCEVDVPHTETKQEAINRARQIIRNQGGGELQIKNERGQLIDSDTIKPGRESQARDRKQVPNRSRGETAGGPGVVPPWRVYSKGREAKSSSARTRAAAKGSNRLERRTPGQRRSPV